MPSVGELMSFHTDRVPTGTKLGNAVAHMVQSRISSVLVVDGEEINGIVTERDVVHALHLHASLDTPVGEIMSSPVLTVPADMDYRAAHRLALHHHVRHLVVANEQNHPLGVITETDFRRHLGLDFFRSFSTVQALMDSDFLQQPPTASLADAVAMMDEKSATCVLIVEDGSLLGIVTERDMVRLFAEDKNPATLLRDIMTCPVSTTTPNTPLGEAATRMLESRIRHLAVVDDENKPVGLLGEHDLMRPLEIDLTGHILHGHAYYQQALLDNFPFMVWLKDTDSRLLTVNQAYADLCGQASPLALIGKTDLDLFPEDLAEKYRADDREVLTSRQKKHVEELITDGRQRLWFETYKAPVIGEKGELLGTVGFARNISDRKAVDEASLLRNAALAGLIRGDHISGILDLIVLALETEMPGWRCSILLLETDGRHLRHASAPSLPESYCAAIDGLAIGDGIGSCGTAAFRQERVIVTDIASHPYWEGFRELAQTAGIGACWSEPIRGPNEKLLGTFAAYHETPATPQDLDIEHLARAGQFTALVLSHHDNAQALSDSHATFRGIFEGISQAVLVLDEHHVCLDLNQGAEQLLGYCRTDLIGKSPRHLSAPALNAEHQTGASLRLARLGIPQRFEHWAHNADGQTMLLEAQAQACTYFGRQAVVVAMQEISERHQAKIRLQIEYDLAQSLASGQDRQQVLDVMLETVMRFPDLDCGGIYWRQADGGFRLVSAHDLPERYVDHAALLPGDSEQAAIIRRGEVVCTCHNASKLCSDESFLAARKLKDAGICCLTIFPVTLHGEVVACLTLGSRASKQLSPHTLSALKSLSLNFSQTLLRLEAEERQRLAASVFENAHEGIMITDARGTLVEVNNTFTELTGYSRTEALGKNADLLKSGHHDPAFYAEMWKTIREAGYWRGEVWNRKKSGEIFVELLTISTVRDRADCITHYVGIFSDITLQKEHQKRLEHLAHFDPLTQLPNRMLLADRLQLAMAQTERNGKLLAVSYLDLDGFKPVNDQHGHAAGDSLLVEVAQRLKACLRAEDTVARLGGDEFVLLFSGLNDEKECDRALSRVINSLSSPFFIAEQEINISASIGVTLFPNDGADPDTLLRHADQAMYNAKQLGRNRYHLFDPESDRRARVRHDEMARIRSALEERQFVLHYQPKVNMRQGMVVGAEALIRWQDPERGLVPPLDFLPAIQGTDLDIAIGNWVLAETLRQMEHWIAGGLDLCISVNIAGTHLQAPGFAEHLGRLLAAHPSVNPGRLELEVLETTALEDMTSVAEIFEQCRRLGVSFSLDDFGTGYSSLTYFRRLPAEILKIDQSFVRDMLDDSEDLAIVEGVIGLTRAFQRQVIAEGVETVEHGMVLLQLGCDLAQGYGIARPMPAADLPAWVEAFLPDQSWGASAAFEWAREDLPMLIAEMDHRHWKKTLLDYLDAPGSGLSPPEESELGCRLGRWYNGPALQRYGHLEGFQAMNSTHVQLHALGRQLIALSKTGKTKAVAPLRAALEELGNQLSDHIQDLQSEILLARQGIGSPSAIAPQ